MPNGNDYTDKVYSTLQETIEGFDKTPEQFKQLMTTDDGYRSKVFQTLKENVEGFDKDEKTFSDLVKKKEISQPITTPSEKPAKTAQLGYGSLAEMPEEKLPKTSTSKSTSESASGEIPVADLDKISQTAKIRQTELSPKDFIPPKVEKLPTVTPTQVSKRNLDITINQYQQDTANANQLEEKLRQAKPDLDRVRNDMDAEFQDASQQIYQSLQTEFQQKVKNRELTQDEANIQYHDALKKSHADISKQIEAKYAPQFAQYNQLYNSYLESANNAKVQAERANKLIQTQGIISRNVNEQLKTDIDPLSATTLSALSQVGTTLLGISPYTLKALNAMSLVGHGVPVNVAFELSDAQTKSVPVLKSLEDAANKNADYGNRQSEKITQKYGTATDAWSKGNYADYAKIAGLRFAEFLPAIAAQTALTATTGGAGAIPIMGSAFGTQTYYSQLANRTDMSEAQKFANSFGTGLFTAGAGEIMLPILKPLQGLIKTAGKDETKNIVSTLLNDGLKEGLKKSSPYIAPFKGAIQMYALGYGNTLIDVMTDPQYKDLSLEQIHDLANKNGIEGMGIGAFGGVIGTTVPHLINSGIFADENKTKATEINSKLDELNNALANPEIDDTLKEMMSEKKMELTGNLNDIILKDEQDVSHLSDVQKQKLSELNETENNIKEQLQNPTIEGEPKTVLENNLKEISTAKAELINLKPQEDAKSIRSDEGQIQEGDALKESKSKSRENLQLGEETGTKTGDQKEQVTTKGVDNIFVHPESLDSEKGLANSNDKDNPEVPNDRLSKTGEEEAKNIDLTQYNTIYVSPNERTRQTVELAKKNPDVKIVESPLLKTGDISEYEGVKEKDFPEDKWIKSKDGKEFTSRMEEAYKIKQENPDAAFITHSKVQRALDALETTGGKWTEETTKKFLESNPEKSKYTPEQKAQFEKENEEAKSLGFEGANHAIASVNKRLGTDYKTFEEVPKEDLQKAKELREVEQVKEPMSEQDKFTGVKLEETAKLREELGMEEYEKIVKTRKELEAEADAKLNAGYDINKLINKMESGKTPSDVEQVLMSKYLAGLAEQIAKNPTDELIAKARKAVEASDRIGGSEVARSLAARRSLQSKDDTLMDYFMQEMDINNDAPLTENQKSVVQKEFDEISKSKQELEDKIAKLEAENNKLNAERELKKLRSTRLGTKKTHEEFVAERKKYIDNIKEKLKEYKASGLKSVIIPGAPEMAIIAPELAKIVRSYVQEYVSKGIDKLEDIVKGVHDELRDDIEGLTEQDVIDFIAGKYSEKKPTRSDLTRKLYDLKQEANLISKLESLQRGEEPKTEQKKIQRNQRIEELRKQIKEHDLSKISDYKKRLSTQIQKVEQDLKDEKFLTKPEKLPLKLDAEAIKLKDKYIRLRQQREVRIMKQKYENRKAQDKVRDKILEVANIPRTIMSSMDFSAPLRQALVATVSHPILASHSFAEMFKQAISQKRFDRWFYDVRDDARYPVANESGLYIADPHDPRLSAKEEMFMNNLAEKIPVIGKLIKGSERAYVGYLNKMRWDLFNSIADEFERQGKTYYNEPKLYKALADFVNNSTGRGKLGAAESAAPILNSFIFAPRLIASRINFLNPVYYAKLPKEVRIQAIKDLSKVIGVGMTILALAQLGGADVEGDPRSTDSGKIKVGNTRWDIWGGYQQYIRVLSQMLTGESKSATTKEINKLTGEGKFGRTRGDVLLSFIRGKLAPVPSIGADILAGRTISGEKTTLLSEAESHLLPLLYNDVSEAVKDQGVKGVFTAGVPSMFGVGVSTYLPKKKEYQPENITPEKAQKIREAKADQVIIKAEQMKKLSPETQSILKKINKLRYEKDPVKRIDEKIKLAKQLKAK